MPKTVTVKRRFNVVVTEADIERAKVNDSYKCVVSQAIARTIPDATNIDTDTQSIRFTVDNERRVYMTPYAVQGYVIAFDAGDAIEPFSFQLRNPRVTARRITTKAGKAVANAAQRARRDEKASQTTETSDPSKAARAAYADAKKAAKGEQLTTMTPGKKPTPRVFKRKQRSYGHRLLRINQD